MKTLLARIAASLAAAGALVALSGAMARANIVDEWSSVQPPPAPALQTVTADPHTSALLLLDFVTQTCSSRPRCMADVPGLARLPQSARTHHVLVIRSVTLASAPADTLAPLAAIDGEPFVQGVPDKFLNTNLQQILTTHGIKTVIVAGMSANGALLSTASHAALAGFNVVVPVDGMPAETPYAEQFVAWNLANAPRISTLVKLTTTDQITFRSALQ